MDPQAALGFGGILLGGAMQGAFALPMKYQRHWRWENTWLVYSLLGMVAFPWLFAWGAVPALGEIYRQSGWQALLAAAVFGFSWGLGSVLCGLSIVALGIALASAIFLGLAAALGSLIPLALAKPASAGEPAVSFTVLGVMVMLAGIALCARAGVLRDTAAAPAPGQRRVFHGIALAVGSGVLSATMNFSFVFGGAIVEHTRATGASAAAAAYPLLAIVLSAGFAGNAAYCVYLLRKNRTWRHFTGPGMAAEGVLAALMALLVFGGFVCYGAGLAQLGPLGPSAGWPSFLAMMILTSNVCGFLTGEWRGAGGRARRFIAAGGAVLLAAVALLALANRP